MSHLKNQLQYMEGKTFQYGGHIHYIKNVVVDDLNSKIKLQTNLQEYTRPFDSAPDFLKQFTEIKTVGALVAPSADDTARQQIEAEESTANDIIAILKNNIQKVQENAAYIPQAKAINNDVNSILNVAKLKIEMRKARMKTR